MNLFERAYKKLYPNGYLDAAIGRGELSEEDIKNNEIGSTDKQFPPGTFKSILIWDDKLKDYRVVYRISNWVKKYG